VRLRVNPKGGRDHPLDQAILERLAALPDPLWKASVPPIARRFWRNWSGWKSPFNCC